MYLPASGVAKVVVQEGWQGQLRFVQDEMIDILELVVFRGKKRSSGHDFESLGFTTCNDLFSLVALDDHSADEGHISPGQVLFAELPDVQVDQSLFPLGGQHGCHSQ